MKNIVLHGLTIEEDSKIAQPSKDFLEDTITRLKKINTATSKISFRTLGQKEMHHRKWLVEELRKSWKDLKKSPPSKSSGKNSFIDYMLQVCEYMEIDIKGLETIHLKTLDK